MKGDLSKWKQDTMEGRGKRLSPRHVLPLRARPMPEQGLRPAPRRLHLRLRPLRQSRRRQVGQGGFHRSADRVGRLDGPRVQGGNKVAPAVHEEPRSELRELGCGRVRLQSLERPRQQEYQTIGMAHTRKGVQVRGGDIAGTPNGLAGVLRRTRGLEGAEQECELRRVPKGVRVVGHKGPREDGLLQQGGTGISAQQSGAASGCLSACHRWARARRTV